MPIIELRMLSWYTQWAASMRLGGITSLLHRNHRPTVSPSTMTTRAMPMWMMSALEKVLARRALSPRPSSKVRKRLVAPAMAALRKPIMAITPPTTP